ncbi:MAG: tRNA lysidine(34) synthetase TilS [bacterium]
MKNKLSTYNKNDIYIVAVSTGVDSMVLLDLAIQNNLNIVVCHVNHNKRDSSIKEEIFIKDYCNKNNIKLEILQYHYENNNFQDAARKARYEFFYSAALKYNANKILTAHHSIDNVETILINILRGSNLKGYSGINNTKYNEVEIERPLITFNKKEIYTYAKQNNITFFEDESNIDNAFLRNNIRNNIIPELEKINQSFDNKFTQYSNLLEESFDFIRETSISYINENKVNINDYNNLHIAVKKDILNCLFELYNLNTSSTKINDCIRLLENNTPNQSYDIQNGYRIVKEYNSFFITNKTVNKIEAIMGINDKCEIPMYGVFYLSNIIPKKYTYITKVCYNEKEFPLKIRTRLNGDKIAIKNGHKKVNDLFTDMKISKEKRDETLIIETSNNEIIWVMDLYKKQCNENFIYLVYEENKYEK